MKDACPLPQSPTQGWCQLFLKGLSGGVFLPYVAHLPQLMKPCESPFASLREWCSLSAGPGVPAWLVLQKWPAMLKIPACLCSVTPPGCSPWHPSTGWTLPIQNPKCFEIRNFEYWQDGQNLMDFRAFWILKFWIRGIQLVQKSIQIFQNPKIPEICNTSDTKNLGSGVLHLYCLWKAVGLHSHVTEAYSVSILYIRYIGPARLGWTADTNSTKSSWLEAAACCLSPTGLQGSRPFEWPPYATLLVTGPEEKQSGRFPSAVKRGSLEMALLLTIHLLELLTTSGQFCSIAGKGENKKYFVGLTD